MRKPEAKQRLTFRFEQLRANHSNMALLLCRTYPTLQRHLKSLKIRKFAADFQPILQRCLDTFQHPWRRDAEVGSQARQRQAQRCIRLLDQKALDAAGPTLERVNFQDLRRGDG
jgi:hypothetical protein